jgi:hypothetical protein
MFIAQLIDYSELMGSCVEQFLNVEVSSELFFGELLKETLDHLDISGVILIIVRVIVVFGAITIRSD